MRNIKHVRGGRMKTKGLSALAVVAILLAAVLAPAMGLGLLNNSNSSVNESECLNESITNPVPDPETPSQLITNTTNTTQPTYNDTLNESIDVRWEDTNITSNESNITEANENGIIDEEIEEPRNLNLNLNLSENLKITGNDSFCANETPEFVIEIENDFIDAIANQTFLKFDVQIQMYVEDCEGSRLEVFVEEIAPSSNISTNVSKYKVTIPNPEPGKITPGIYTLIVAVGSESVEYPFEWGLETSILTLSLTADKKHFAITEKPAFTFEYTVEAEVKAEPEYKKTPPVGELKNLSSKNKTGRIVKVFVYDSRNNILDLEPEINKLKKGKFRIEIPSKRSLRPGTYTLKVELAGKGKKCTEKQFQWGLVSLNTRKSIYKPGETAEFIIVVLDKNGHSVCDADISMRVTNPNNRKTAYSTAAGTITPGSECGIYNADYLTKVEGNHTIDITAQTLEKFDQNASAVEFSTYFLVQQEYEFDIVRTARSKIDPTRQDWFDVKIDIESFVGANSITIKEFVPAEFDVSTDAAEIVLEGDTKILTWNTSLKENEISVNYSYSVPHIWPYLYEVGPVEIDYRDNNRSFKFVEARPWMLAVDPNSTTITISCNPNVIKRCEPATISGVLESTGEGIGGKTVNLSYMAVKGQDTTTEVDPVPSEWAAPHPNGGWHSLASVTTESDGSYSYSWTPPGDFAGYHIINASFAGDVDYDPCSARTGIEPVPNLFLKFSTCYAQCYNKSADGWPIFNAESGIVQGDIFVKTSSSCAQPTPFSFTLPGGTLRSAYLFYGVWAGTDADRGYTKVEINGQNVMPMFIGKDALRLCGGTIGADYHYCACCCADCNCPTEHPGGYYAEGASPTKELFLQYNYSYAVSGCGAHYIALNLSDKGVLNMNAENTISITTWPIEGELDGRTYGYMFVAVYENSSLGKMQYWINHGYRTLDIGSMQCSGGHWTDINSPHSYVSFPGALAGVVGSADIYLYGLLAHGNAPDPVEFNGHELTTDTTGPGSVPYALNFDVTDYVTDDSQAHHYITSDYNVRENVWILKVKFKPDLIVKTLAVPGDAVVDETYLINATIRNNATENAGAFKVGFYENDVLVEKKALTGLTGETVTLVQFDWTPTAPGFYTLKVIADSDDDVSEISEDNNEKSEEVIITAPGKDIIMLTLQAPGSATASETYVINATIGNCGDDSVGGFNVKFYENFVPIDTKPVSSLASGAKTHILFNWQPTSAGTYTLKVVADSDNAVPEFNEDNNEKKSAGIVVLTNVKTTILRPDGAGTYTQWTVVGASSNWEAVDDEITDEDSTYVSGEDSQRDTYALADFGSDAATIHNVTLYVRARKETTGRLDISILTHGTLYDITKTSDLTTSYKDFSHTWENNPATGEDWTAEEVNALQAGVYTTYWDPTRVTQVWVAVNYTPTYKYECNVSSPYYYWGGTASASAHSDDPSCDQVKFKWFNASGTIVNETANLPYTPGTTITDTYLIPDTHGAGIWGVTAQFYGSTLGGPASSGFDVYESVPGKDLVVKTIDAPGSASINENVVINATILNRGTESAEASNVALYEGEAFKEKKAISSLASGAETEVQFNWQQASVGTYTLTVVADSDNNVSESYENNNESSVEIDVEAPDLVVISIDAPNYALVNETQAINATIKNNGTYNAGAFNVTFYEDDTLKETKSVSGLDAGAETQLEFNWAPTSGGAYVLKVVADIDNEVSESNESNNESSVEVNGAYLETVVLRPDGPGFTTQWDVYGAASNWEAADDEAADADTTYIYTDANYARDLFTLQDIGFEGIHSVKVYTKAKENATDTELSISIRTYAINYESPEISLTPAYVDYSYTWEKNPATGESWTVDEVNVLQAGVQSHSATETRVTQVWVAVVKYSKYPQAQGSWVQTTDADFNAGTKTNISVSGDAFTLTGEPPSTVTIFFNGFEDSSVVGKGFNTTVWAVEYGTDNNEARTHQDSADIHTGSWGAEMEEGDEGEVAISIQEGFLDLTGYTNCELTFWIKLTTTWEPEDRIYVDIYDGSWHYGEMDIDGEVYDDGAWHSFSLDLSGYNMIDGFRVRFDQEANADTEESHWDDIKITREVVSYETSGNLISQAHDTECEIPTYTDITVGNSTPDGTTITTEIRSAAAEASLGYAAWHTDIASVPELRWVQWRGSLTGDGTNTPTVYDVTVNWTYAGSQPPDVATPETYDSPRTPKTVFQKGDGMFINVSVTDANGGSDLSSVLIKISDPGSAVIVNNESMTKDGSIVNGYVYNYSWTVPGGAAEGEWTIEVYAKDISNTWDSNSATFTVEGAAGPNDPPAVDTVTITPDDSGDAEVQINPVAGGTKTVTVTAQVSDPNGYDDISTVKITDIDPNPTSGDPSFVTLNFVSGAGTTATYEGTFGMEFYDSSTTYTVTVTATDTGSLTDSNSSPFEYQTCIALALDTASIAFGSVDPGNYKEAIGDVTFGGTAPTIKNNGNVKIDMNISGTEMSGSGTIPVNNIYDDLNNPKGYTALSTTPAEHDELNLTAGASSVHGIDFKLNVPSGTSAGDYFGTVTLEAKLDD